MFLFKKKISESSSGLTQKQRDRLNEADEAYMLSFMSKSIRQLDKYMSRECMVKVSRAVYSSPRRYFGASKFRKTNWTLVDYSNETYTVRKDVKFDAVKLNSLSCAVSTDYSEIWCLNKECIVVDITQC